MVPPRHPQAAVGVIGKLLLIYAALPAAYVIAGRLGLLLAISPGYATAVFLPAGIAVGAAFIAGAVTLPATLIGSFLLNIWIGYAIGHQVDATTIATALVIALASTLQAGLGGAVLRRAIGYPAALDNPGDLLSFVVLSPVICLISATVSLAGMWALGVIAAADLPTNWLTWWVGDTLGVLVALPLMLVIAGEPRTLWRYRSVFVALPMVLCFALFVAIFVRVRGWETEQSLSEFQLRSQQLADSMKAALQSQSLSLEQLSSAFASRSVAVTRPDFRVLVQPLLQRFPTIQAVEWAPRVTSSERQAFEIAQQNELPGFAIRAADSSGRLTPAGDRAEYYPITYIEPVGGNETAEGFDLASTPERGETIEAAVSSGSVVATKPIRLVQENADQSGVLMMHAVSDGLTGPGVVLVVLRMGSFTANFVQPLASTLGLRFVDADSRRPLFDNLSPSTEPTYQAAFDFGRRRYFVETAPTALYLAQHRGWQSWVVLAGGVLTTGLLGALLMLGTGHTFRVENLARKLAETAGERRRAEEVLRAKEAELETVINRTPFMLIRCSPDLRFRFVSPAYAQMLARRPEEIVGRHMVEVVGETGLNIVMPYIRQVLRGERAEYEAEVDYGAVGKRFLHGVYTPDKDAHGNVVGWIASIHDITDRKRAESQRDLLIAEVNHRVKNTLATVISIAHQSFKRGQSVDAALRSFDDRIRALAQTHTRLAEAKWSGISLATLVEDETAPYRTDRNMRIAGPDIVLAPKSALSLGMALHELATNAAKYGALSAKGGAVAVNWEIAPSGDWLRLGWIESGGPAVNPPQQSGFGRLLLEKALASDLDGTVELDFRPEGLRCLITFPLGQRPAKAAADSARQRLAAAVGDIDAPRVAPAADTAGQTWLGGGEGLNGARILVVEDESLLALELQEALDAAGASIIGPFGDLAGARQAARREAIDFAVLDTNLGGEMVYPLADELAARGIPFLFVTGYERSNLPEQLRAMPRMAKPFDHAELIREIQMAMAAVGASQTT